MKKILSAIIVLLAFIPFVACSDDDENPLNNDYIKRTTSPLLVGEEIEFAYAMGTREGKLKAAYAEASVAGATGTNFEPYTWRTENGTNISTIVARDCKTEGTVSSAQIIDAQATTLRYYYVIPEELRGKEVSFTFSSESAIDRKSSIKTDTYKISMMDMRKLITMVGTDDGACYFSIEDMKAYTKDEVETGNLSSKIDFIFAYAASKTVGSNTYDYKYAFFSPAATGYYPDGFTLPVSWEKKSTLMEKKLYVWDGQLKNDINTNIYVDDADMKAQTFNGAENYALDIRSEGSVFMKTSDGKYIAYIYINSLANSSNTPTAVIGIKRYKY